MGHTHGSSNRGHETCAWCGEPTGRSGEGEDSIYIDTIGPWCEECYHKIHNATDNTKVMELLRIIAKLAIADNNNNPNVGFVFNHTVVQHHLTGLTFKITDEMIDQAIDSTCDKFDRQN
jgi:hypothetical protein